MLSEIAHAPDSHPVMHIPRAPQQGPASNTASPLSRGPYVPKETDATHTCAPPMQLQFEPSAPPPPSPPRRAQGSFYPHAEGSAYFPANAASPLRSRPAQYDSYRKLGTQDVTRASGLFDSGIKCLDAKRQRMLTREYDVWPQGKLHLVIVPANLVDLASAAPRNHYKRFQIHKFSEQMCSAGKMTIHSKLGEGVVKLLKTGADALPPLHSMAELAHPVEAVFQEHSTWKIEMREVTAVFKQKRQGWNRKYSQAQRIFQGSGSVLKRKLVQMQHAYLYGGASGVQPLVNIRKDLLEVTGNIIDAYDFLELMEYGIRRGKPRMFTYVLMEQKLYMAETGAEFFRDIMSKHAMHCSAAPEVVYAGELHFRRAPQGSNEPPIQLVVDNNSGTYAPDKEDLPKVEEVFRRNFDGLHVTALDFQDPLLARYRLALAPSTPKQQSAS